MEKNSQSGKINTEKIRSAVIFLVCSAGIIILLYQNTVMERQCRNLTSGEFSLNCRSLAEQSMKLHSMMSDYKAENENGVYGTADARICSCAVICRMLAFRIFSGMPEVLDPVLAYFDFVSDMCIPPGNADKPAAHENSAAEHSGYHDIILNCASELSESLLLISDCSEMYRPENEAGRREAVKRHISELPGIFDEFISKLNVPADPGAGKKEEKCHISRANYPEFSRYEVQKQAEKLFGRTVPLECSTGFSPDGSREFYIFSCDSGYAEFSVRGGELTEFMSCRDIRKTVLDRKSAEDRMYKFLNDFRINCPPDISVSFSGNTLKSICGAFECTFSMEDGRCINFKLK